jgi:hypothetical protein
MQAFSRIQMSLPSAAFSHVCMSFLRVLLLLLLSVTTCSQCDNMRAGILAYIYVCIYVYMYIYDISVFLRVTT